MKTEKIKMDAEIRFILKSYLKGIIHALVVPYSMLWIFQSLGLWAFGISTFYVIAVGTGYTFSTRHDLSRASFYGTLLIILAGFALYLSGSAVLAMAQ